MLTVLIHGFWGGPADWSGILRTLPLGMEVWTPDLYEPGPLGPHHTLEQWRDHFLEELRERAGSGPVQAVGYSMSGRMLTAALVKEPSIFKRALVLSARPLPVGEADAKARQKWELEWRERFLKDSWESLEKEWNDLSVFSGSATSHRRQSSMIREMLGQSMINWSPTQHPYSEEDVKSLPKAVEWAFGASDQKYLEVAKDLAKLPVQGQISIIENAGHRLPLDAGLWVAEWITRE